MNTIKPRRKIPAMRSMLAAALLAGGSTASAGAVPVELTLEYSCNYPLIGDQPLTAEINSEMPEEQEVGEETGEFDLDVLAIARGDTWVGLDLVGARQVEGTAIAESNLSGTNLDLDLSVPTDIPLQSVPDEPGDFEITATGSTPSLEFDANQEGEVVITVGNIDMELIARDENDDPVFFPNSDPDTGEFPVPCQLEPDQDTVLHSFEIVPEEPDAPARISVSPEEVDFGSVQSGLTGEETVTVSNDGGEILSIDQVSLGGPDADEFMQTSDCTTLNPDQSCEIELTYFATGAQTHEAVLSIESSDEEDPVVDVPLTGESFEEEQSEIHLSPEALEFGPLNEGESEQADLTVSNEGNAALNVQDIVIGGDEPEQFNLEQHDCAMLDGSESCTVTVSYTQVGDQDRSATLTIQSDADNEPSLDVPMTGLASDIDVTELAMDLDGETVIEATGARADITGSIEAAVDLATGMYTGELQLDPTDTSFRIFKLFRTIRGEAEIEFEQLEETTGVLQNGELTSESTMDVIVPKFTLRLFGFPITINAGNDCRTAEPVTIAMEGDDFSISEGGSLAGTYALPPLENCKGFEDILSSFMAGSGNTIDVDLTPKD